jgi:hypothetical protein
MQEPYEEGLASRLGPGSCAGRRKGVRNRFGAEALHRWCARRPAVESVVRSGDRATTWSHGMDRCCGMVGVVAWSPDHATGPTEGLLVLSRTPWRLVVDCG